MSLDKSIHPSRQACPFIAIRMAVNSWSQPWLGLIRLPDTMDTQDRQISEKPMGEAGYIDELHITVVGRQLGTEMKSHIINWFKWESHTHKSMGALKHKLHSIQFDKAVSNTPTHTHSYAAYLRHTHAASHPWAWGQIWELGRSDVHEEKKPWESLSHPPMI